jgi:hypothetical protein
MRTRIATLVPLLAALGCHTEGESRPYVPAEAAAPSAQGLQLDASAMLHKRESDAGVDPLCKTILAEEKLDESALRDDDRTSAAPRLRCMGNGKYAWAVRADKIGDAGTSIKQTIIFAGPDNARARLASTVEGVEWPPTFGHHAMVDFDNDGVPELVAIITKDVKSFAPASRIFVTMKKGAITPYPTGGSFLVDGVVDSDKDGHPDLRISYDLGKRTVCAPADEGHVTVELLAHALPDGKFSVNDAVATAAATKHCPAMPTADALFTPSITGSPEDRDLSTTTVACERLRGKSAEAVVAEINAACAAHADATAKCAGPCRHVKDALAVANFAPPVQLK